MKNAIEALGREKVYKQIITISRTMNVPASLHIDYVCNVCCGNPEIAPDMNSGKKRNLLVDLCANRNAFSFFVTH